MLFKHEFVEGSFNLFKTISTQHFHQGFGAIDTEITNDWNPLIDRPTPEEHNSDYEPYNRYTIEWWEHTPLRQAVDWNRYTFKDLFDYEFSCDDYSIHSHGHLHDY